MKLTCIQFIQGKAIARVKGHELTSYETSLVVVGLLFKFTTVELRGPNKTLNLKPVFTRILIAVIKPILKLFMMEHWMGEML